MLMVFATTPITVLVLPMLTKPIPMEMILEMHAMHAPNDADNYVDGDVCGDAETVQRMPTQTKSMKIWTEWVMLVICSVTWTRMAFAMMLTTVPRMPMPTKPIPMEMALEMFVTCDTDDVCEGFDDTVDSDNDGTPDGCDPCPDDTADDSDL